MLALDKPDVLFSLNIQYRGSGILVQEVPTLSVSVPLAADARKQNICPVFFIICKILCKVN